jgi:hypothetical protein
MSTKKLELLIHRLADQIRAANDQLADGRKQAADVWSSIQKYYEDAEAAVNMINSGQGDAVEVEEVIYKHLMFIAGEHRCRICGKELHHGNKAYGRLIGESKFEVECLECGSNDDS